MLESQLEKKISQYAQRQGWEVFKFSSPNNRGVADRIMFKEGVTLLLEVKRPGEKPTALQKKFLRDMRKQRIYAWWTDSFEDAKKLINIEPKYGSLRHFLNRWKLTDDALKA